LISFSGPNSVCRVAAIDKLPWAELLLVCIAYFHTNCTFNILGSRGFLLYHIHKLECWSHNRTEVYMLPIQHNAILGRY
jgi:hypothetical protein